MTASGRSVCVVIIKYSHFIGIIRQKKGALKWTAFEVLQISAQPKLWRRMEEMVSDDWGFGDHFVGNWSLHGWLMSHRGKWCSATKGDLGMELKMLLFFFFFFSFICIHDSGTDQSRAAGVTCKHRDGARVCVKLPLWAMRSLFKRSAFRIIDLPDDGFFSLNTQAHIYQRFAGVWITLGTGSRP